MSQLTYQTDVGVRCPELVKATDHGFEFGRFLGQGEEERPVGYSMLTFPRFHFWCHPRADCHLKLATGESAASWSANRVSSCVGYTLNTTAQDLLAYNIVKGPSTTGGQGHVILNSGEHIPQAGTGERATCVEQRRLAEMNGFRLPRPKVLLGSELVFSQIFS